MFALALDSLGYRAANTASASCNCNGNHIFGMRGDDGKTILLLVSSNLKGFHEYHIYPNLQIRRQCILNTAVNINPLLARRIYV